MHDQRWIDDVIAVVADVDWAELNHAYGSAEQIPLALRTWLSGDGRAGADVDRDDEVFPVIADYLNYESPTVAEAALSWIYVSVFHQGSLYSASPPTCRVMVAVLDLAPIESVRADALGVLEFALTMQSSELWQADGFHRLAFQHVETYDEIVRGFPHYLQNIGTEQRDGLRRSGAGMLAWMPEREASAEAIIDVLIEDPEDDLGVLEAAVNDEITASLLRTLGLVARGTSLQDQAEAGIRSFLDDPDDVGLAACLALVALRRVDEADAQVVARLKAELVALDEYSELTMTLLDAFFSMALHCISRWKPEDDRQAAAGRIGDNYLQSLDPTGDDFQDQSRRISTTSMLNVIARHHRLDQGDSVAPIAMDVLPQYKGWSAHSAAVDDTRFALGGDRAIHLVSLETLMVDRTLTVTAATPIDAPIITMIESSRPGTVEHWHKAKAANMSAGVLAVSPDGRWLGAYGTGQIGIWDLHQQQDLPVAHLCGFTPTRVEFAWSPDSRRLVTAEAGDVHFWSVDDWSAPTQVVAAAIDIQRLAWTGRHPHLIGRDRVHRWNIETGIAERVSIPQDHYPIGVGPAGRIMSSKQPSQWPVSNAAMFDDTRWVQLDDGQVGQLVVSSAGEQRRIQLGETNSWATAVWWWPDGRMFAHQDGNAVTFRRPAGDAIATCTLVDTAAGDLVWMATDDEANLLVSRDHHDALRVMRPREFDRPTYVDDPGEKRGLLAEREDSDAIIQMLQLREPS